MSEAKLLIAEMIRGGAGERAVGGMKLGAAMATLYMLYVLVLFVFRGNAPFEAIGASVGALILAYYAGGLLAGAAAGLLWPLTRYRTGAIVVAIPCTWVVVVGISMTTDGPFWYWSAWYWFATIGGAVIMGVTLGLMLYRRPQAAKPALEPSTLRTVQPEMSASTRDV
jgi:hypothetical protein